MIQKEHKVSNGMLSSMIYFAKKNFFIVWRSDSLESGGIKGFRQTLFGGHVSILFKY